MQNLHISKIFRTFAENLGTMLLFWLIIVGVTLWAFDFPWLAGYWLFAYFFLCIYNGYLAWRLFDNSFWAFILFIASIPFTPIIVYWYLKATYKE